MRRSLAGLVVALLALAAVGARPAHARPTGAALPGLEAFDEAMAALLRKWDVPGAGLAVARKDKLILVRGYGLASKERSEPVTPTSLFRLASLSKTVTAVAVLQLVQEHRLGLDDKVLPLLGETGPRSDRITDPRVRDITVRHLLQHAGGFDRARSGDAVFPPGAVDAARRQGGALPPDCATVLRDALERRLDFAPGERFAYSNLGYCILGRIVERVTGTRYETHVRERVLEPAGAGRMRIGRTREAAEDEVSYYDHRGARLAKAVPGVATHLVARPYGTFAMETMDAFGGWIGAPADYLRFILAIDGRRGPARLDAAMLAEMTKPSGLAIKPGGDEEPQGEGAWYGLGIRVRDLPNGMNLWHGGSLPGTNAHAMRTADGVVWVVAVNGRPENRARFRADLVNALWAAKAWVKRWPDGDVFPSPR